MTKRDYFLQLYRNGRWGDCANCPRDNEGHAYPEFCKNTEHSDHNLTVDDMANECTPHALMNKKICDSDFSTRVMHRLRFLNIETFSELRDNLDVIKKETGFGRKSMNEVIEKLKHMNI